MWHKIVFCVFKRMLETANDKRTIRLNSQNIVIGHSLCRQDRKHFSESLYIHDSLHAQSKVCLKFAWTVNPAQYISSIACFANFNLLFKLFLKSFSNFLFTGSYWSVNLSTTAVAFMDLGVKQKGMSMRC